MATRPAVVGGSAGAVLSAGGTSVPAFFGNGKRAGRPGEDAPPQAA